ncbi:hypothetical protein SY88_13200 [Clostridiales bacterium PH28_bin88]|nr:hypothetical protein SY88_13200 [Clostridiales bacterium PH28_bin88]
MPQKMVRKQVYLPSVQEQKLKKFARKNSVTEAEIFRRAIDNYIQEDPLEEDPLLELFGCYDGEEDESLHHDEYVYGQTSKDLR